MASATRLPLKSILFTGTLVLGIGASRVNLRSHALSFFTGSGRNSRILAAVILLANLKNVPFAWHYRVWGAILRHCLFSKPRMPPALATSSLFLPVISSSYSPLSECDYNLHKSNSTYFSDLDVSRSHLVCALLQPGIERLQHNVREKLVLDKEGQPVRARWLIMLGGVMCSFKREIGIYEGYKKVDGEGGKDVDEKAIFASAISKYVIKLGRLTVHPEVFLQASDMLPPKPGGWSSMSNSGESTPETLEVETTEVEVTDEWDWRRVEAENKRGLAIAEHLGALDTLHHEFTGSQAPAVGRYRDFISM
ncbi:Uncharacterized protein LHYA1_G000550 [Lachnellula hyalina]|uniref:Thioesterase atnL n=1 Tax=Lachnellula hyalina TaxID=1316788 RepID=A0A8H8R8K2_9HELO|nr:Uncharacterized protein LHYA1_G000550 [Lachnellula hyalina]TVY30589.1 Uncharacterized protein LHYA1_G000550 [Lachnellula hyalina]